jgi:hypothetical protein
MNSVEKKRLLSISKFRASFNIFLSLGIDLSFFLPEFEVLPYA